MKIGKADVLWNFGATILKVASGLILLPLVLRILPAEDIGLWTVFVTVGSFTLLLDFGFSQSFSRNITYVFSGVKDLKIEGYEMVEDNKIDYGLLKGLLVAMKRFYFVVAAILMVLMLSGGSFYINHILENYSGNHSEALMSWGIYLMLLVYQIYTIYYEALLQGRGLIRSLKKIIILSQVLEIAVTSFLLLMGAGLFSMAAGKFASVLLARILTYRTFFDDELLMALKTEVPRSPEKLFKIISPNAIKIGISALGGFLIQRTSFFLGSLYLSLNDIASYGITLQVLTLISALSSIYITTYLPKMTYDRVKNNIQSIKELYVTGSLLILFFYITGAFFLTFFGNLILEFIKSKTFFLTDTAILLALVLSYIETNYIMAGTILYTKNEVPFFKASIISGAAIFILMILCFEYSNLGLYNLILVPLCVNIAYQGWKWPLQVVREFDIDSSDFGASFKRGLGRIVN